MAIFAIFRSTINIVHLFMKLATIKPFVYCLIGATLLSSCGEEAKTKEKAEEEVFDEDSPFHAVFDDAIFSIPSPIQTGYLIKKLNLTFDQSLLSPRTTVDTYVTEHQQALNLGVYGTDLGYVSMYGQKNSALNYLNTIEKLTEQLGLDAAFDSNFIANFEKSNGNEDEMVLLMSKAFKKADNFLKNANRKAVSAKILTGGWIESMYIACQLNSKKESEEIVRRIGEQKQSLKSIIELLNAYNLDKSNDALIEKMNDLQLSFDKIILSYEYVAPETDASKHFTTFNNTYDVDFNSALVLEITTKINNIRSSIIKA